MARRPGDNFLIAFHAISCVQFSFAVYYDYVHVNVPTTIVKSYNSYGGKFKFLTFWNGILQSVFFFLCLANDFAGSNEVSPKKRPILRRLKDYFHATLGFPVSMFVGVTFWAVYAIDRELVLPKAVDLYFPWWLNHQMHTLIMVCTISEMIIAPRQYPKRFKGLVGLLIFMFIYLVWMHVVYALSGVWAYPLMEVLSLPVRVAFFVLLFGFSSGLYLLGETLDRILWGRGKRTAQAKNDAKQKSK